MVGSLPWFSTFIISIKMAYSVRNVQAIQKNKNKKKQASSKKKVKISLSDHFWQFGLERGSGQSVEDGTWTNY